MNFAQFASGLVRGGWTRQCATCSGRVLRSAFTPFQHRECWRRCGISLRRSPGLGLWRSLLFGALASSGSGCPTKSGRPTWPDARVNRLNRLGSRQPSSMSFSAAATSTQRLQPLLANPWASSAVMGVSVASAAVSRKASRARSQLYEPSYDCCEQNDISTGNECC